MSHRETLLTSYSRIADLYVGMIHFKTDLMEYLDPQKIMPQTADCTLSYQDKFEVAEKYCFALGRDRPHTHVAPASSTIVRVGSEFRAQQLFCFAS